MPATNLRRIARTLEQLPRRQMIEAAKRVKASARTEAARDIGGDLRFTNMGRRGVKVRAIDTVRQQGSTVRGKVVGLPIGAWSILNDGAAPHEIRRRRGGKKRAARGTLLLGGRYVTGPVRHPGTRPRGTWRRVQRRAAVDVPRGFAAAVAKAVR